MKTWMTAVVISLGITSVSGCVNPRQPVVQCTFPAQGAPPPGSALVAHEYGAISPIPLNAVQFTETNLSKQVAVQLLQARRTATNTVQVTARFVNCTDTPLVVGVRTNFMDVSQSPTESATVWQNVVLHPRALGMYQESSMSKEVESYIVELRDTASP